MTGKWLNYLDLALRFDSGARRLWGSFARRKSESRRWARPLLGGCS